PNQFGCADQLLGYSVDLLMAQKREKYWPYHFSYTRYHIGVVSQARLAKEHGLRQSVGATFHPYTLDDTGNRTVFYKYLRLLPSGRQKRHLALAEYTTLSFARV